MGYLIKLFCILVLSFSVSAQSVPEELKGRIIKIIVPYAPGGSTDLAARQIVEKVSKRTGLSIVILNRPGASGNIGAMMLATAKPDGLTLAHMDTGASMMNDIMGMNNSPNKNMIVPVSATVEFDLAIVVAGNAPYNTWPEFVAYLRKNEGKLAYGTVGGTLTLFSEQVLDKIDITRVQAINYKSSAQVLQAILTGEICFTVSSEWQPLVEAGTMKVLALAGKNRDPNWLTIPILREYNIGVTMTNYNGLFAPVGVSDHILQFLNKEWANATSDNEVAHSFTKKGHRPIGGDLKKARDTYDAYYSDRIKLYNQYKNRIQEN